MGFEIGKWARRLLIGARDKPVDLSEIDGELSPTPKVNKELAKKHPAENIEVLPAYEFVLKAVENKYPAIFVTGRAGTGKSTIVRFLCEKISKSAVVAPTGIAAINVQGQTIHSFFNIPPRPINPEEVFEPIKRIAPVMKNLDVLIIDEISMVTPDLIDCINNSLKKFLRNSQPFGGVPVVFVGDLLQLPPVITDRKVALYYTHRYNSPYFFSADVFKETEIFPVELTKVFRQEDKEFIDLLDSIRTNINVGNAVMRINQSCLHKEKSHFGFSLNLVPTNAAAESINKRELDGLSSALYQFKAEIQGHYRDNRRRRFPAPDLLEIKEGAQVLFVKNNFPYWVNGTVGTVVNINDGFLKVRIQENDVSVQREEWGEFEYQYNAEEGMIEQVQVGSFTQFPLALGWAITIHKSQGMTLDSVNIDMGNSAFATGQTYVALSRCRSLQGISLESEISEKDVKADETILKFYERLKSQ